MGDGVTLSQNVLKPNDIIVVVDTTSLPDSFLGSYGKVTEDWGYKVMIEFKATVLLPGETHKMGALRHTARPMDLKKVGEANG
jgi:hypothetical protein